MTQRKQTHVKNLTTVLAMLAMVVMSGCTQGTPGGPGTTDKSPKTTTFGQAEGTFNLTVPLTSTSVQQGETTESVIGIKRATNFDEDVSIAFSEIPKGVTVEPANPVIKHGDTDAKVTFTVANGADAGEFRVKVAGHPTKGGDAHVDFRLTVTPKDTFTLTPPRSSTSLKQGETKTISIGIKRDKTFDQDVALEFGDLPTGVTRDPQEPVIKNGDSETRITLTTADDASLGNFSIKLTGHPAKGADAISEFKLTVIKP